MDPLKRDFTGLLESVELSPPDIPYISNITGTWITEAEARNPRYWIDHTSKTVRFSDGLSTLAQSACNTLLEVGPGQSLGTFALQHPHIQEMESIAVIPSIRYESDQLSDEEFLKSSLDRLNRQK
jgi:acyl transferase domain-containing protein